MKILGVSLVTILMVAGAYYAGRKQILANIIPVP